MPVEQMGEGHLVIVDGLPVATGPRNRDRLEARTPALIDRPGTTMAGDERSISEQLLELQIRDEGPSLTVPGRVGLAVLNDHSDLADVIIEPAIDPVNEPIERMNVGADRDHEQRWDGGLRGHHTLLSQRRGPMSRALG